jgi:hypothetical protein
MGARSLIQAIGEPVSNYALPSIGGERITFNDLLEGKRGAVTVFWSGVCSHCVRYDDYLNNFAERHPEIGFAAIASRNGETRNEIRDIIAERKLSFLILHDPDGRVATEWFTQQTPRAFLTDSNRILLYRGAIDNYKYPQDPEYVSYLEPAIREYLSGVKLTRSETASFGCAIKSVYYILPKAL